MVFSAVEGARVLQPLGHPVITVVIPVYNNAGSLRELHRRLRAAIEPLQEPLQVVFVDDGSRDESTRLMREIAAQDPGVTGISLSRNFGQQAAVTAGLDVAEGDWTVVMDADLQDRPEHIPTLLAKAREGYDMVYGIGRADADGWWRRSAARLFAAAFRFLSRTQLPWRTGLFRVFNRSVLDAVRRFPERQRFVLGLLTWAGYRSHAMELPRDARHSGRSQFGSLGLISLATDALLSFSIVPLRSALVLGGLCSLTGAGWAVLLLVRRLTTGTPLGMASILCSLLVIGGVQLLVLGVIGEYVGRIYVEVQARPLYLVRETFGRPLPAAIPATSGRPLLAMGGDGVGG